MLVPLLAVPREFLSLPTSRGGCIHLYQHGFCNLTFLLGAPRNFAVNSYCYRGDKGANIGPLEKDELEQFYAAGLIGDSTMITEVGSDKWERYDEVSPNVEDSQQAEELWTPPASILEEITPHPPQPSSNTIVVTPEHPDPKYSPIVRAAWMVAKIIYAILIIMSFVTLAGCGRLNDLLSLLVVIAILVVIGLFGAIIDKRVSLPHERSIKKGGWHRIRPIKIAILTVAVLAVAYGSGYALGLIRFD